MRVITIILVVLLALLQYPLWFGERNLFKMHELNAKLEGLEKKNQETRENNQLLAASVEDLSNGLTAVEEVARRKLGMVKQEEIFVHEPPEK